MLSALILAALVRLSLVVDNPLIPTGIFTGVAFIMGLLLEHPFLAVVIGAVINFGLGYLFFWMLKRTEGAGSWWVVLSVGIVVFVGLSFF